MDDLPAIEALRDIRYSWNIQDTRRTTHPNKREYTYHTGNQKRSTEPATPMGRFQNGCSANSQRNDEKHTL